MADSAPSRAGSQDVNAGIARWAGSSLFFINGTVLASYYVRMPVLKVEHGLTAGQLGAALTVAALAALLAMQFAGALATRLGSAPVARLSAVGVPLSLLMVALSDGYVQLLAALLLFGALSGLLDVAMNAQAIAVERLLARPIMNGCHGAWSIGSILGSLLGGAATAADWSLTRHYLWLAVILATTAAVTGRWLLPAWADQRRDRGNRDRRVSHWRAGWSRTVVLFGLLGAGVLLCEGAVGTWSGVFLHEDRGAAVATASLAYIGFTICQATVRMFGDRLQLRFGAPRLVGTSSALAMIGLALALSPWTPLGIAGFSILGVGLAALIPVIFSAVGHGGAGQAGPASVAAAVSRFTTLAYSGLLIGPAAIGWLAEVIGLGWTLAGMELVLLGVLLAARKTATADRPATTSVRSASA